MTKPDGLINPDEFIAAFDDPQLSDWTCKPGGKPMTTPTPSLRPLTPARLLWAAAAILALIFALTAAYASVADTLGPPAAWLGGALVAYFAGYAARLGAL